MSLPLRKARWIEKDDLHCHSSSLAKIVPVIILARFLLCLLPFHSICPFFLKSCLRYRRVILFFSFFPLFLPDTWRKERINGDPRGGCQFRWMDGRNKRMPRFIGCVRESDDRMGMKGRHRKGCGSFFSQETSFQWEVTGAGGCYFFFLDRI